MYNDITIPEHIPIDRKKFDGLLPFQEQKVTLIDISYKTIPNKGWALKMSLIINDQHCTFSSNTDNSILIGSWYDQNNSLDEETMLAAIEYILIDNICELMDLIVDQSLNN